MSANTRKLVGLLGDVRRQNNFVLTILDVTEEGNNLDLIVKEAFLPSISLGVIELRHGNEALRFAGEATWEGGTVTIIDVLSRKELDAINDWFDETFKDGKIGFADDYKKDGYITEYAGDGKFARKWDLKGMWISNLDPGMLNAASAEGKEISFTIQIDPSSMRPTYDRYPTVENDDGSFGWEE